MNKSPAGKGATLTREARRDKIPMYAGMVELVDSVDFGAVTLVEVS